MPIVILGIISAMLATSLIPVVEALMELGVGRPGTVAIVSLVLAATRGLVTRAQCRGSTVSESAR